MRTTRNATKAASGNGKRTQKRKNNRQPKSNSRQKEKEPPTLDELEAEQKQVGISQNINVPSIDLSIKEESYISEEPPNCQNPTTEYAEVPEAIDTPEKKPSTPLLHQQESNELLALLSGCLNQVKNEVIEAENHGNKITEVNDTTALSSSTGDGAATTVYPCEEMPESNVTTLNEPNPATCATEPRAETISTSQSNKKASFFNGSYKLYRFMNCEWFYSHVDRLLFAEGESKNTDMGALLNEHFPSLFTRSLNRVQWNYIRMKLRKIRPVRRLSHAFLLNERINLERRREKLRFLMENSMIEYLDDDIPSDIPKPIDVGSTVRVTSFQPHYGTYTGEVIGVENRYVPLYLVRFPDGSEQTLPDYRVALDQSFHIPEASDTVSVTSTHLKQIGLMKHHLDAKNRLLHELENIRLNLAARHAMNKLDTKQDHEQIALYDQTVRKLLHLNRNLLPLMKQIATDYEQYMSEPLTADEVDVFEVDKSVVEVADELLAAYAQLDHIDNSSLAERLWQATMQRLHKRPEYLQQFEEYLASNIGKLFHATPSATAHRMS